LADVLKAELREKGRLAWHEETCARLVLNCAQLREIDQEQVWRLPGSHQLDRLGLAVLRELWQWRDEEAVAANKPPYFILKHETLVELASSAARSHLGNPDFPRWLPPSRQTRAVAAIERALALRLHARLRSSDRGPAAKRRGETSLSGFEEETRRTSRRARNRSDNHRQPGNLGIARGRREREPWPIDGMAT
jgi:ribonuclease D